MKDLLSHYCTRQFPGTLEPGQQNDAIFGIPYRKGLEKGHEITASCPEALSSSCCILLRVLKLPLTTSSASGRMAKSVCHTPFQLLKGMLRDRIFHYRSKYICSTRADVGEHGDIDLVLLRVFLGALKDPQEC